MNNRAIFDQVCMAASRHTTRAFSTSFSLGVRLLPSTMRGPIHAIYGFVRFADEIVDTFLDHPREQLLNDFERDTWAAIDAGISLNPILQSFQLVVHRYGIERDLVATFLHSMRMDLHRTTHDHASFKEYVLGSAEVVGLMCLRVFCQGDDALHQRLKGPAMRLGAAFQKVNFLRDLQEDGQVLGRAYFPGTRQGGLTEEQKRAVEADIRLDMDAALEGIRALPQGARPGVYLAFLYYRTLLRRIERTPAHRILQCRIRVPDILKLRLLLGTYVQHRLNLI